MLIKRTFLVLERGITRMSSIKAGDIFRKNYIDHERYFLALKDQFGMYCDCIDIQSGEREIVKIPVLHSDPRKSIVTYEVL